VARAARRVMPRGVGAPARRASVLGEAPRARGGAAQASA